MIESEASNSTCRSKFCFSILFPSEDVPYCQVSTTASSPSFNLVTSGTSTTVFYPGNVKNCLCESKKMPSEFETLITFSPNLGVSLASKPSISI